MRQLASLMLLPLIASAPALAAENISVPAFSSIELRGGGEVTLVPGAVQRVTLLDGSSAFTRIAVDGSKLKIDACNARCPKHYRLRIEVQTPHVLGAGVRGGGSIRAAPGFAAQDHVAAGVSGGGIVDLRAINGANVAAGVDGGGQVLVRASATLAAGVNGGGEVRYLGNPHVTSAINGGGTVRPAT